MRSRTWIHDLLIVGLFSSFVLLRIKDAGITVVNEVGVDPGIDHMLAMQVFDEVKEHGGKVGIRNLLVSSDVQLNTHNALPYLHVIIYR